MTLARILVRESGTEPVVRVMVEAPATIPARSMCLRSWRPLRAEATEFERNFDAACGLMYISPVPLNMIFK